MNSKKAINLKTITIFVWVVIQAILSYRRSFWMDEWFRVHQMSLSLFDAYHLTLRELPPYTPGEIVLGWISSRVFFFLPAEIWGRLPSILFGALTLGLAFDVSKFEKQKSYAFALFLFFSVSLTTMSTQFRSYAALIYCGSVAFLWAAHKEKFFTHFKRYVWFGLLLGHFFGVIYISAAAFFKRQWKEFFFGLALVISIMVAKHITGTFQSFPPASLPSFVEMTKQSLGTLANPHKAWLFYAPLFAIGVLNFIRLEKNKSLLPLFIFFICIFFPIASVVIKKYFFLPRIIVAGIFPFLFFTSLGFDLFLDRLKIENLKLFAKMLLIPLTMVPWILFISGVKPFIDQPLHRVHLDIKDIKKSSYKNIINLDYYNEGSVRLYFDEVFSDHQKSQPTNNPELPYPNRVDCWKDGPCLTTILDEHFGPDLQNEININPDMLKFIPKNHFDVVMHGIDELNFNEGIKTYRAY